MKTPLIAACALITLVSHARAKPLAYGCGQPGTETAVPAEITAETRLGPAAGNGTHPFALAVDTRRNRLWVLNQVPQSLSVVDLATRSVVGVVKLAQPQVPQFEGWGNSNPYIWIGYDPKADRVLLGAAGTTVRSVMVSIDAGKRQIQTVRTLNDRLAYRWAINPKRGEVAVAEMGSVYPGGFGVCTMDSITLGTRAELASRQIEAMAASPQTGRLYTVEPSNPPNSPCGMGGPYSSTRVFVRNPVSGAVLSKSPGDYAYPRFLFVDDTTHRLYLVHRSDQLHMISSELTTVTVLSQSTLKRQRTLHFKDPDPNSGRDHASWYHTCIDLPRHRLLVDFLNGALGILNLQHPEKPIRVPVEGSMDSDYRLAGVITDSGQPLLLMDNAVNLLNASTLKIGPGITLGASIQDLFLDVKRHRLLAYVDRSTHEFLMLDNMLPRRLFRSYLLPRTRLLAVDFDREAIYSVYADGWGSAASLGAIDFHGERAAGGYLAEGEISALILTESPGRSFRLLFPAYPESTRALPRHSLDLLKDGREIRSVALPQLSPAKPPSQLLYAPQSDRLYIVFGNTMAVYDGSDLAAMGEVSLAALSPDRPYLGIPGLLAVAPSGEFAYYADPINRQVVKLRLSDGRVAARRQLTFAAASPLVDDRANRLYLTDTNGGRVLAIRLF